LESPIENRIGAASGTPAATRSPRQALIAMSRHFAKSSQALVGRAPSLHLDPAAMIELLGETPLLSPGAKGAAGLMLAGNDTPMFPVELVAKDFRYAIGTCEGTMPVTAAALGVFERAATAGFAGANLTAVHRLYTQKNHS
jgi:3-hydroxyisobutyrate dehydrogenase-like beta-hydroxyacid dehydrogenase